MNNSKSFPEDTKDASLLQTKNVCNAFHNDATDIKKLTELLKEKNSNIRKQTALLLGHTGKVSALTPLCNIALLDGDEGVRVVTATAILDIARRNSRNMKIAIKVSTHPLLTSLQKFQTPPYVRCIGWVLSNFEFSEKETEAIINILQKKYDILMNSSCKDVLTEVIKMLKKE